MDLRHNENKGNGRKGRSSEVEGAKRKMCLCFKRFKPEAPLPNNIALGERGKGQAGFHFIFALKTPFLHTSTKVQISTQAV